MLAGTVVISHVAVTRMAPSRVPATLIVYCSQVPLRFHLSYLFIVCDPVTNFFHKPESVDIIFMANARIVDSPGC